MTTLNELDETFNRIEKTVDHLLEFVEDVEKMRKIQKILRRQLSLGFSSCQSENDVAEAKVDAFLAKRKNGENT
jgi:hypothetical protein